MRSKELLIIGGLLAGISVGLGAMAAHGLKKVLAPHLVEVFATGVQYQFLHAFALLVCALLLRWKLGEKAQKYFFAAAICFIIGVFCFSGSLYALALTGMKWLGPITPLGGALFMVGWGLFVYAALQIKEDNK